MPLSTLLGVRVVLRSLYGYDKFIYQNRKNDNETEKLLVMGRKLFQHILSFCVAVLSLQIPASAQVRTVQEAELFFNIDPGPGNGIPLVAVDGSFNNAIEAVAGNILTMLGSGTHTINVRVKDQAGNWGPVFSTVLNVGLTFTPRDIKITAGELFFNTDPGEGNGVALVAFDGMFNDAVETVLGYVGILPGLGTHVLHVRVRDQNNVWSTTFKTVLNIGPAFTPRDLKITAGEMFFNTDPGLGLGIPLLSFDGTFNDAVEEVFRNSVTYPGAGLHKMGFRVQDVNGNWSPTFSTIVNVTGPFTPRDLKITAGEMFFNTDPGLGLGIPLLSFDGTFNDAVEEVFRNSVTYPGAGLHKMGFRVQDVNGNWSPTFSTIVNVTGPFLPRDLKITAAEYYIDTDPGVGLALPMVAFDGSFDNAVEDIAQSATLTVDTGLHLLGVRVRDQANNWGPVFRTIFYRSTCTSPLTVSITPSTMQEICAGDSVLFTAPNGFVSYKWFRGATLVGTGQTYWAKDTGFYQVLATLIPGCEAYSAFVEVKHKTHTVTISPATVSICSGDNATLTASTSASYLWSTGATSASITVNPLTTTTYTVTATGTNGCAATTSRVVTVNAPPTLSITGPHPICIGGTTTVSPSSGGTWVSWHSSIATVSGSGLVTASSSLGGLAKLTFTETATGCSNSLFVEVRPLAQITSDDVICFGNQAQLIPQSGGTWVSNNPSVATVSPSGVITPLATGTATFTFTESFSGCTGTTSALTVGSTSTVNTIVNTGFDLSGITRDSLGYMYVCDRTNNRILRITPGGVISVYATGLDEPAGLTFDTQGYLYVSNYGGGSGSTVVRIPPGGGVPVVYATGFSAPFDINRYDADTLILMEYFSKRVYKIFPGGGVAGSSTVPLLATPANGNRGAGVSVYNNKDIFAVTRTGGTSTHFYRIDKSTFATTLLGSTTTIRDPLYTTKWLGTDLFFVSDYTTHRIYRVNGNTAAVTAVAGSGASGNTDGPSLTATLSNPYGVWADREGNVWFTHYTGRIRKHNECKCTPTVAITGPASICVGDTTTLSPSAGGTWVSNNPTVASVNSSGVVTGLSNGSATFTFTNPAGCSATTGTVTVNAAPAASISPATAAICDGGSITLTASGGGSYSWSHGLGSGASKTVSPTSTTTYTVTVTTGAGCTAVASRTVTVHPNPSVSITGVNPVCVGNTTTLSPTSGGTWVSNNPGIASVSPTGVVTGLAGGTATFTFTDANGCSATTPVVTVSAPAAISPSSAALCVGDSITLTASGGTSYIWSTGATTASITVSPGSITAYSVTVSGACVDTASRTVVVHSLPTPAISPDTADICDGGSITLTASGGVSYSWSHGLGSGAVKTVSPASTTTYSVTVTSAFGCTASTSRTVTVHPNPTVSITGSSTICAGQTTTLSPASGGTWVSNNPSVASVSPSGVVTGLNAGTATFTFTDVNGCLATTSAVTVLKPTVTPSSPSVCSGNPVLLTASAGVAYSWSHGPTTDTTTVTPLVTTTYTVTVTYSIGCTASASSTVTVSPSPTPDISPNPAAVCIGDSITLVASGGVSYSWSTGATTVSIKVAPTVNTTYSVTVTNGSGCTATASRLVTVNPLPTASISPATAAICDGSSVTLTASGGVSYNWSHGLGSGASKTVSPTVTTTYNVTATDANGCSDTASRTVTVYPNPTVSITGADSVCVGQTTTLSPSSGGTWTSSNMAIATVTPSGVVTGVSAGNVAFTFTDANGCFATTDSVNIKPLPAASISPFVVALCQGLSVPLTASGGGTYSWSTGATTATITVSPPSTTTYHVTVTGTNSCTATVSRLVTVNPLPTVSITGPDTICIGANTTVHPTSGGIWTSSNTSVATVTHSGLVTGVGGGKVQMFFTDANGCSKATDTIYVEPVAYVSGVTTICVGATTTLYPSSGGTWTSSNPAVASVSPGGIVTGLALGTATFSFTNGLGCTAATGVVNVTGTTETWYLDADLDGWYAASILSCGSPGIGWTNVPPVNGSGDCNDANAAINPGATEICGNGIDEDCSGADLPCGGGGGTITWLGYTNDWHTGSNWSTGVVPSGCSDDIYIPSVPVGGNYPVVNAPVIVGDVQIDNQAIVTLNQKLSVCGNIIGGTSPINIPSFLGSSYVELSGSGTQSLGRKSSFSTLRLNNSSGTTLLSGAEVNIYQYLELQNGTINTTNGILRFKSPDETGCAMIDNFSPGFSGSIIGTVWAERGYANAGSPGLYNQHYFASPINLVPFTQFAPAKGVNNVFVTPTADCDETKLSANSNYGNVFEYEENNVTYCNLEAWRVRSSGNAQNGRGYSVVKQGSGVMTLNGSPNLGNYAITGLNNSGWNITTKQGNNYEGGWHLLGNPYLSSLDLDYSLNSDFDDNVLVLHTHGPFAGTYQPLSMSGSGVIAPFQGFFARKSIIGGAPATFSFSNTNRSRTQTAFHKAGEHQMSLMVEGNGYADITYFNFNVQATNGFDAAFDGGKFSSFLNQPTIYSLIGGTWASVNTNSDVQSTPHIPVGFNAGNDGVFQITASGFDELVNTTVYLEDKKENVMHNLTQTPYYTFAAQKGDNNERFVLHFNQMISSIDNEATSPISVNLFPNPANEMVYIEVKEFKPKNKEIKVELVDMNGKTVLSTTINNGKGINISQIAPAVYQLKITTENGSFVKRLVKE